MTTSRDHHEVFDEIFVVGPDINGRGGMAEVLRIYRDDVFPQATFHYSPSNSRHGTLRGAVELARTLCVIAKEKKRRKILHLHSTCGKSFYRKFAVALWARLWGYKILVHWHGGKAPIFFSKKINVLALDCFQRVAHKWVTPSPQWSDFFSPRVGSGKIIVIPNPVIAPVISKESHQGINILFLGGSAVDKGFLDLIEAFEKAGSFDTSVTLLIAGDGLSATHQASLQRKLKDINIELKGWLTGDDKKKIFAQTDILVHPSHYDFQWLGILEAMACGIAVVVTNTEIDEVMSHRNDGDIPCGNTSMLAQRIKELVENNSCRLLQGTVNMSKAALHSPLRVREALHNAYCEILERYYSENR